MTEIIKISSMSIILIILIICLIKYLYTPKPKPGEIWRNIFGVYYVLRIMNNKVYYMDSYNDMKSIEIGLFRLLNSKWDE